MNCILHCVVVQSCIMVMENHPISIHYCADCIHQYSSVQYLVSIQFIQIVLSIHIPQPHQ